MNVQTVKDESLKKPNKSGKPSFLELSDGRRLAYCLSEGRLPGVVFMGGFNSDMTGTKAMALEAFCIERGQRFLRFDYTGHGQSSGNFIDGTIGAWKEDALDMLDKVAVGNNILVGSSMGGWIMLLAAQARKDRVAGLVGIASAPDFTQSLVEQEFTSAQKKQLIDDGVVYVPSCSGEAPYPFTRSLIEDGKRHLMLGKTIPIDVPVRLIHGQKDEDVPWQVSVKLAECLASSDVVLSLVKDGGHRLSEPEQLALICRNVEELLTLSI